MDSIPDDYLVDFIDGKLRRKTAEEYVRQNVERSLVQEYRYTRDNVSVEFSVKLGSSRKAVDLAVFPDGKPHAQDQAFMLIECKREGCSPHDKKEGIDQLKSYMAACVNCRFGLWTNGSNERICFQKEVTSDGIEFAEIVDIVARGQSESDLEQPDRHDLRPATQDNLLLAFKRCHNYIAGNQGLQKTEAFWELLKVIFCKIEDERALQSLSFFIGSRDRTRASGQLKCKKRIEDLFQRVKIKYTSIFAQSEEIELNRSVLAYVVSQLQAYSLLDSPVDVKGVAYEEIVGSNLRGDRGEFFTPRNACTMAVRMLDPQPYDRIIDPACGTGGFLVIAMNHVLKKFDLVKRQQWRNPSTPTAEELAELYRARQELMSGSIGGLDLNPNLVRASKMNMVMNNDGSGGLAQADSLKVPQLWSEEAQSVAPLGQFDFLFTNPPFGTKIRIDDPQTLEQFDLAAAWDLDESTDRWHKRLTAQGTPILQGSQPPEILFIERSVRFLKQGTGRMAIVIPNGILNNAPLAYVRQWLLDNVQLLAVVDMHRDLFQPQNDTQTSMVFCRRLAPNERPDDYPIFFAVTTRIGHDKRGHPIYKRDLDGSDILTTNTITIKTFDSGKLVDRQIEETGPIIDDQLSEIPAIYEKWRTDHGV